MNNNFKNIKYFRPSEFDSPDQPGSGHGMNYDFVWVLDKVRYRIKRPIRINSGVRTKKHNKFVGGTIDSSHLTGNGSDIHCPDNEFRYEFIFFAIYYGITRLIIHENYIHADNDPDKPNPILAYGKLNLIKKEEIT